MVDRPPPVNFRERRNSTSRTRGSLSKLVIVPVVRAGRVSARTVLGLGVGMDHGRTLTDRNAEEPGARAERGSGPGTEGLTEGETEETGPGRTIHISMKRLYRELTFYVPDELAIGLLEKEADEQRR